MPHTLQRTRFRRTPIATCLIAAFSLSAPTLHAAETTTPASDEPTQLGAMVVMGGKISPVPKDLPAVTEGVTAEKMAESINVINTEDALKYLPSIHIRKRFIGDTNGIVASRTGGTLASARSLVYGDNLLLSNLLGNTFSYPPRWGLVTADEIERIDVIYGPFSALYPGNSMGATILMTTRMPEKFEAHAKVQAFTQKYKLYGTDEDFAGNHLSASLGNRSGDWSWWLSADRLDSHGQPMQFATKPLSSTAAGGADTVVTGAHRDNDVKDNPRVILGATGITHTIQEHAKLKVAYDVLPTVRATYTLGLWQNDAQTRVSSYLRDAAGNPVYSGNVNIDGKRYTLAAIDFNPSRADQEHWMHGLSLKTSGGGEWDWEAVASLYDYNRDISRTPTVALPGAQAGGAGRITNLKGTGWQVLDLRGVWRPQGIAGAHEVSFGYHRDHYKLRTLVSDTTNWIAGGAGARRSAFTGDTETTAFYAQEVWRFAPAWKAVLGGRWEDWKAHDGSVSNATTTVSLGARQENYFSPKAALTWQATPLWALRASLGRAYRTPTVAELYQGTVSGTSIVNNDPNLKPEKVWSGELTAERDLGNGLLRISYFRENLEDALYAQTDTTVFPTVTNIQNIDKVRTNGLELAYQAADVGIRGLDLSGSLTWTDSVIKKNDKNPASVGHKQPRIPDWRASLSATYRQTDRLSYALGARYSGRQYNTLDGSDINPDTYGGMSSFFIVDARLRYKLARHWSAAVGVDNLNNAKAYAFHPYPQRVWTAELKFDY
ncbi:MAG: TonB-dependent receptor [Betaproteobacteria bacterium HGW-Betaproteobacteria-11]|nr:MAG: TonB-dependent receptor [Betaproteobacteria bacterium HGW-Betaproteobacteria-11]